VPLLGLAKMLAEQARRHVLHPVLISQVAEPVVLGYQKSQPFLVHRDSSAPGF
jgi:hypothetical protein